jgi:hypothetical protein
MLAEFLQVNLSAVILMKIRFIASPSEFGNALANVRKVTLFIANSL